MGKIIVLGGGTSVEREVSLRSAQAVQTALTAANYDVLFIDPAESKDYLNVSKSEIIFPILHGEFGEDGELQSLLEEKGIIFLGSDSVSSKQSFDKQITREILEKHNIRIPRGEMVSIKDYSIHPLSKTPHVVKVAKGGSSIGTFIQRDGSLIDEEILKNNFSDRKMLIEELVSGIEVTVPILDKTALPVIEIEPPKEAEFDYENKYNGKTKEICPPISISVDKQKEVQLLAEKVHNIMDCRHLSRVDIIIDTQGNPYVLEINTMPGLTDESLYPKAAKEAGLSMPDLMDVFVKMVKRDYSLH